MAEKLLLDTILNKKTRNTKKNSEVKKRRKDLRADIINLAMEQFDKFEYNDIQMKSLAEALEVSNGSVFYHFPTKQTLFFEIYLYYYMENVQDNIKMLDSYRQLDGTAIRDYLLSITDNMFEKHFNMLRLIKIHSLVMDKGVVLEKVQDAFTRSMEIYEEFQKQLVSKSSLFNQEELEEILQTRSAIVLGNFYMFMEPTIIDEVWSDEKRRIQRNIYRQKVLSSFDMYLQGRIMNCQTNR